MVHQLLQYTLDETISRKVKPLQNKVSMEINSFFTKKWFNSLRPNRRYVMTSLFLNDIRIQGSYVRGTDSHSVVILQSRYVV